MIPHSGRVMRQCKRLSKIRMQFMSGNGKKEDSITNTLSTSTTKKNTSSSETLTQCNSRDVIPQQLGQSQQQIVQRNYTTYYHQPYIPHYSQYQSYLPYVQQPVSYMQPFPHQYTQYYSTSATSASTRSNSSASTSTCDYNTGPSSSSSSVTSTTTNNKKVNTPKSPQEKAPLKVERDRVLEIRKENNANFKKYLSELPVLAYPEHYQVQVINKLDEANNKITEFLEQDKSNAFGLDLEWQPVFVKGQPENKVSLVQICSENRILLIQISRMFGIPTELRRFFENRNYVKSGVNIVSDGLKLYRDFGLVTNGLVDLRDLVEISTSPRASMSHLRSLRALTGLFLDQNMAKGSVRISNWSRPELTPLQIKYAALDAYASYKLFVVLEKLRDPKKPFVIKHLGDDDLSRVKKPGDKPKTKFTVEKRLPKSHQHNNKSSPTSTVTIIKKKASFTTTTTTITTTKK